MRADLPRVVSGVGNRPGSGRKLSYVIGAVVTASGAAMAPAAVVSLLHGEQAVAVAILGSSLITVAAGWTAWRLVGRQGILTTKDGFAAVGLAWFVMAAFGTLPWLLSGEMTSFTDAYFETASGYTTTGSSVIPDLDDVPRGLMFWRSSTQWIGGMGVIVLSIAVLPLLGTGGTQLARAESPGPSPDRLTPRFQETAKRLWILYAALTLVQTLMLWVGDMDLFQAVNHSMATVSTGGFGTEDTSLAGFSPYSQWVIVGFMFLAGMSFTLHYRALRNPVVYLRSTELRLYAGIVALAVALSFGGVVVPEESIGAAFRDAAFTTVSIVTTTGFATADFGGWRPALEVLVVGLMFIGGMAGSTAGGVKVFRVGILSRAAVADVRRLVHPRGVFVTRFGGDPVRDDIVESVQSFFLFYMFLFMTGTFLLAFIDANSAQGLDIKTAASAVASSLGNIGPGIGEVGPSQNYQAIPQVGRWLLSTLMIVGRLEIFPVALLLTRDLWRR